MEKFSTSEPAEGFILCDEDGTEIDPDIFNDFVTWKKVFGPFIIKKKDPEPASAASSAAVASTSSAAVASTSEAKIFEQDEINMVSRTKFAFFANECCLIIFFACRE